MMRHTTEYVMIIYNNGCDSALNERVTTVMRVQGKVVVYKCLKILVCSCTQGSFCLYLPISTKQARQNQSNVGQAKFNANYPKFTTDKL